MCQWIGMRKGFAIIWFVVVLAGIAIVKVVQIIAIANAIGKMP